MLRGVSQSQKYDLTDMKNLEQIHVIDTK
jgi:hypothetical protein